MSHEQNVGYHSNNILWGVQSKFMHIHKYLLWTMWIVLGWIPYCRSLIFICTTFMSSVIVYTLYEIVIVTYFLCILGVSAVNLEFKLVVWLWHFLCLVLACSFPVQLSCLLHFQCKIHGFWRCKPSEMFHNLDWWIFTNAAKGYIVLIFRVKEPSPWRWWHCALLKHE